MVKVMSNNLQLAFSLYMTIMALSLPHFKEWKGDFLDRVFVFFTAAFAGLFLWAGLPDSF